MVKYVEPVLNAVGQSKEFEVTCHADEWQSKNAKQHLFSPSITSPSPLLLESLTLKERTHDGEEYKEAFLTVEEKLPNLRTSAVVVFLLGLFVACACTCTFLLCLTGCLFRVFFGSFRLFYYDACNRGNLREGGRGGTTPSSRTSRTLAPRNLLPRRLRLGNM